MLKDFVDLIPGDWVVQNGANSAVGNVSHSLVPYVSYVYITSRSVSP